MGRSSHGYDTPNAHHHLSPLGMAKNDISTLHFNDWEPKAGKAGKLGQIQKVTSNVPYKADAKAQQSTRHEHQSLPRKTRVTQ